MTEAHTPHTLEEVIYSGPAPPIGKAVIRGIVSLEDIILNAADLHSACDNSRSIFAAFIGEREFVVKLQSRLPRLIKKIYVPVLTKFLTAFTEAKENGEVTADDYELLVCCCESLSLAYHGYMHPHAICIQDTGLIMGLLWECCIAVYKCEFPNGTSVVRCLEGVARKTQSMGLPLESLRTTAIRSLRQIHGSGIANFMAPVTDLLDLSCQEMQTGPPAERASNSIFLSGELPPWLHIFEDLPPCTHRKANSAVTQYPSVPQPPARTTSVVYHPPKRARFWHKLGERLSAKHALREAWTRLSNKFWEFWYPADPPQDLEWMPDTFSGTNSSRQYVVGSFSRSSQRGKTHRARWPKGTLRREIKAEWKRFVHEKKEDFAFRFRGGFD